MTQANGQTIGMEVFEGRSFVELQALAKAAADKAEAMKESGLLDLADKLEAQCQEAYGFTVKQVMAAARKAKRGKPGRKRKTHDESGTA